MALIQAATFKGRPAVTIGTRRIELTLLLGGGHIASVRHRDRDVNPLWDPPWPTLDPSQRRLGAPEIYGSHEESELLSSIYGHNLCLDVFGEHSRGESAAGLSFHGEAGMVTWEVTEASESPDESRLTVKAELPLTALTVTRTFIARADAEEITVEETLKSHVGFERIIGRAQHVTLGKAFLDPGPTLFSTNADRGMTWPDPPSTAPDALADFKEFEYPDLPLRNGESADWRIYPRSEKNGDLSTLRIRPSDSHGWFVAAHNYSQLAIAYIWERSAFPWLMTWEENHFREQKPWNARTLTRGLEFSSNAFALGRKKNAELDPLFDTPTHEWLDAHQTRKTRFTIALRAFEKPFREPPVLDGPRHGKIKERNVGWTILL